MSLRSDVEFWQRSCLRKNGMKEEHANEVIARAKAEGNFLRSYLCDICLRYHVTKKPLEAPKKQPNKYVRATLNWRDAVEAPSETIATKVRTKKGNITTAVYENGRWTTANGDITEDVVFWKDSL